MTTLLNQLQVQVPVGTRFLSATDGVNLFGHFYSSGTPEAAVTAPVGSVCVDVATGELYRKASGAGNTGWVLVGGDGTTNLSFERDATTVTVESSTGNDAILPAATDTLAGVMVSADKVKVDFLSITEAVNADHVNNLKTLSGMAGGSDDLGTFTGSTIPDSSTIKSALQELETFVESIVGGMTFAGTWDATSPDPSATLNSGEFFRVSVAGTTTVTTVNMGAVSSWAVGDFLMKDNLGNVHKMDNTDTTLTFTAETHELITLSNGADTVDFVGAIADSAAGADDGTAGLLTAADKLRIDTTASYSETYGDGAATAIAISHSLGSTDVQVAVFRVSDGLQVFPTITRTNTSTVTLTHSIAPTLNQYRVYVSRVAA